MQQGGALPAGQSNDLRAVRRPRFAQRRAPTAPESGRWRESAARVCSAQPWLPRLAGWSIRVRPRCFRLLAGYDTGKAKVTSGIHTQHVRLLLISRKALCKADLSPFQPVFTAIRDQVGARHLYLAGFLPMASPPLRSVETPKLPCPVRDKLMAALWIVLSPSFHSTDCLMLSINQPVSAVRTRPNL
jgi:hypothetical protein